MVNHEKKSISLRRFCTYAFLFVSVLIGHAQQGQKKSMQHEDLLRWNRIMDDQIAPNGDIVTYNVKAEEGNAALYIYDVKKGTERRFERSEEAEIDYDSRFVAFLTKHDADSLKELRRKKVDKDDLPLDSLTIYRPRDGSTTKIPDVTSFKLPEKWGGWLAYTQEIVEESNSSAPDTTAIDVTSEDSTDVDEVKKMQLVIRAMDREWEMMVPEVESYRWAKEGKRLALISTNEDSTFNAGVYLFDVTTRTLLPIFRGDGEFSNIVFDENGEQLSFISDLDTSDAQQRTYNLHYWRVGQDSATMIADENSAFMPTSWLVNKHKKPTFSENGKVLYFGINPPPVLQDTALLEEEIVQVEVWSYTDGRLHTQQKKLVESERKRAYSVAFDVASNRFTQLADEDVPDVYNGDEGNSQYSIGVNETPYLQRLSWVGFPAYRDIYLIDNFSGERKLIKEEVMGFPRFSPRAKYVYWYDAADTAYYAYNVADDDIVQVTTNDQVDFFDELHDTPNVPSEYGIMGWTANDEFLLVYDRFDIWKIDPQGKRAMERLTDGRNHSREYRYVQLDEEKRYFDENDIVLLQCFDDKTKSSGYTTYRFADGKLNDEEFTQGVLVERSPLKASRSKEIIFKKESFVNSPNLFITDEKFSHVKQISDVNPQQAEYRWGNIELFTWTAADGQKLQGQLVKPDNFDPKKKYPMIVNFYERSSDRLNTYRRPSPGRSTINYPFYASRGYVIFNPDVPYRVGYPGESAFNAVVSGVAALIDEGFIDEKRIGAQGHSWGGYQVAYLATKTDIFACIESGAPVVNMTSAYGGIRWGSGLSRMFQYERTQSRLGATLWEKPLRYIENSPLFFIDKINTPILILHNDGDGHVPWYQGIEFFVAMRRLGKPAWLLNYNGEPHWPLKLQNRVDFNIRMQQFFDHYLMDAPMPKWMRDGVPAIDKGINQGLGLLDKR